MIVYWRRTSLLGLNLWWGKGLAFVSETAFNLEHGAWSMEHGAWSMEHGAWSMELEAGVPNIMVC
ncbi:TPA: hypothetical protein MHT58_26405 [Klebsiella pneumoniae]|nr:hypothetical protein [Klebsiella pneumoniae]